MATAEFSKFAGILSAAHSQHHFSGFEIAQLEFHHLYYKPLDRLIKKITEKNQINKIRNTKGTFHAKMGTIKDRNGMDLIEAEDIKKRWQEYTEKLQKRSSRPR